GPPTNLSIEYRSTTLATETQLVTPSSRTTLDDSIVFFDGRFVPLHEATVNIATHALHYGTGCFEGIRGYWVERHEELYVLKLPEHVDRFFRSCNVLRIRPPFTQEDMAEFILEVVRSNEFRADVYIRPLAFKSAQTIKLTLSSLDDSFAIFAFPFGHYAHREGGLRVCMSPWRRVDDTAIPTRAKVTGSYVNASLASDDATRAGYDEALMLTHAGNLSEASSANIFLVRGGKVVTPALSESILEGITRECVIDLVQNQLGLEVVERTVGRTEPYLADEVFLSGTGVQIEPVVSIDGVEVGSGLPGPVTTRLQDLYARAVRNQSAEHHGWCTPVYGS
ncbi:MAG TPA: branched-chain amino acid transaminase, partial [Chloroflexota bacterium]|nr:branched-chain amino acid transaminase [Chloroflexota bacterium]